MEYITQSNYPPSVDKFTDTQIADQSSWATVPDSKQMAGAMCSVEMSRKNGSTETVINPLDPGDGTDNMWRKIPCASDRVTRTGVWK